MEGETAMRKRNITGLAISLCVALMWMTSGGLCGPASLLMGSAQFVPEDTVVYIEVPDYTLLKNRWNGSAAKKLWDDENIKSATASMRGSLDAKIKKMEEQLGVTQEHLVDLFPGGSALALTTIDLIEWRRMPIQEIEMVFIGHCGKKNVPKIQTLVQRALKDIPTDAKKSSFKVKDSTVYSIEWTQAMPVSVAESTPPSSDASPSDQPEVGTGKEEFSLRVEYAFTKGYFVIGEGRHEPVKKVVSRIEEVTGLKNLTASPSYASFTSRFPSDLHGKWYFNTGRLLGLIEKQGGAGADSEMLKSVGLSSIPSFLGGFRFVDNGMEMHWGLGVDRSVGGIGAIITCVKNNPFNLLKLAPKETISFWSMAIDIKKVWNEVHTVLRGALGEKYSSVMASIEEANRMIGANIEQDLINALGNEIGTITTRISREGKQEDAMVLLVELSSRERFKMFLDNALLSVNAMMPFLMFDQKEYQGYTMYVPRAPEGSGAPPIDASFVITDRYFLFASHQSEAKNLLSRISGKKLPDLTEHKTFARLSQMLPAGGYQINYSDAAAYDTMMDQMAGMLSMMAFSGAPIPSGLGSFIQSLSGKGIFQRYFTGSINKGCLYPEGFYDYTFIEAKQ